MMEGPLLEGKLGTEPSIVDAGEVTGADDGEGEGRGCEWFSGSNSHVSLVHTLLSTTPLPYIPCRYQLATSTSFPT